MNRHAFPVLTKPLPQTEGGVLALVTDLRGRMGYGGPPAAAAARVQDAIDIWSKAADHLGHAISAPSRHLVPETAQ